MMVQLALTWQLLGELLGLILLILRVEDDRPPVQADLLRLDNVTQQRQRVLAASVARAPAQHAGQIVPYYHRIKYIIAVY